MANIILKIQNEFLALILYHYHMLHDIIGLHSGVSVSHM